jgi:hypothetical protein
MAKDPDRLAASFEPESTGFLSGFLADEDAFDRRAMWRVGLWAGASVGAVVLAVYASHSSIASRRDQLAPADLARQEQQIQSIANESQNERRRLASAIETLNGDRDRLYYRVTALEQGLESMTGAIAKQSAALSPPSAQPPAPAMTEPQTTAQSQAPAPPPVVSPVATVPKTPERPPAPDKPPSEVATTPEQAPAAVSSMAPKTSTQAATASSTSLIATKSLMAPPDAAAGKLIESDKVAKASQAPPKPEVVAASGPADEVEPEPPALTAAQLAVQRTEFGVDVGGANSLSGLRALWRGLLKSKANAVLTTLRPIIVIRENSNGLGMQLRLVAGPLGDAAAAAKICAGMFENERPCETAVFDGQRLAMNADDPAAGKPNPGRRSGRWRSTSRRVAIEEPAKKPDPPSPISSLFGVKR